MAHYVRQRCASHEFDKEHVKCTVHRIPNDFRITDSARAVIMMSQGRLSFRRGRAQYCPFSFTMLAHVNPLLGRRL
jgi:hypothetical protein